MLEYPGEKERTALLVAVIRIYESYTYIVDLLNESKFGRSLILWQNFKSDRSWSLCNRF